MTLRIRTMLKGRSKLKTRTKAKQKNSLYKKAAELFFQYTPKRMLPNEEVMQSKYSILYGSRDYGPEIEECQRKTAEKYLLMLTGCALLMIILAVLGAIDRQELVSILRPAYGEPAKTVMAKAHIRYDNIKVYKEIPVKVMPKTMTESEKEKLLRDYADRLPETIKGENKSLTGIKQRLILPESEPEHMINIRWRSSKPDIVNTEGAVDNLDIEPGRYETVLLTADLELGGARLERSYEVFVTGDDETQNKEAILAARVERTVKDLGSSTTDTHFRLPDTLGEGIAVKWVRVSEAHVMEIFAIFVLTAVTIYISRYGSIDKQIKEKREAVSRDFPEFTDKLILLLNAGMVVNAALLKIPQDYERFREIGGKRALYEELLAIRQKVVGANASYAAELMKMAERVGVKELVRLSAIICENINKGTALAEKLETEANLLWQDRKKRAEELGRIADTKLVLPLFIMLGALITVTIMPALMSM